MSYYYHPRRFGDNYMKPVIVASGGAGYVGKITKIGYPNSTKIVMSGATMS